MLRVPIARGPKPIAPWNHATTFPCDSSFDVRMKSRCQSGS